MNKNHSDKRLVLWGACGVDRALPPNNPPPPSSPAPSRRAMPIRRSSSAAPFIGSRDGI